MSYYNKGGTYSGGRGGGGNYRGGGGSYRGGGRSSFGSGNNNSGNNEWRGQRNSFGNSSGGSRGAGSGGGGGSRYFNNNQTSSYESRSRSSFGGNNSNPNSDRAYSSRPRQDDYHHNNSSYSRGDVGDYGSRDYGRGSPEQPRKRGRSESSSYNMGSRSNDRSFSGNDSFPKNYYEKNSPSGSGYVEKSNFRESRSSGGDYQYRKPAGTSYSAHRGGGVGKGPRGNRPRITGGVEGSDVVRRVVRTVGVAPSRFVARKRLADSSYAIRKRLSGRADYLRRLRQMRLQRFPGKKDGSKEDDDEDIDDEELEEVEEEEEEFEEVEEEEEVLEEFEEDLEDGELEKSQSAAGGDDEKEESSAQGKCETPASDASAPKEEGKSEDAKPGVEDGDAGKPKDGDEVSAAGEQKKKVIVRKKIIKKVLKKKVKAKAVDLDAKKGGGDSAMETECDGDRAVTEVSGTTGEAKENAENKPEASTSVAGQSKLSRLKCQHCGFACVTFNDYSKHLTTKKHLLAMKNASNKIRDALNLMRNDQRKKQKILDDQARENNLNLRSFFCNICKLAYRTLKSEHLTSSSHRKMKEYLLPFCRICKLTFKSPWGYEVHLSELAHVKKKSRVDKFRARLGEKVDDVSVDPSGFMVIDAVGSGDDDEDDSDVKSETGEGKTEEKEGEADTEDGDEKKKKKKKKQEIKLGAEHCKLVEVYFCELCNTYLPLSDDREKSLTVHCRSRFHLEKYVRHRDVETLHRRAFRIHKELEKEKEEMRKKKKVSVEASSPSKKSDHPEDKIWSEVDKDLEDLLNGDGEKASTTEGDPSKAPAQEEGDAEVVSKTIEVAKSVETGAKDSPTKTAPASTTEPSSGETTENPSPEKK